MPRTELRGAAFRDYMEQCKRVKYENIVKTNNLTAQQQAMLRRKLRMKRER